MKTFDVQSIEIKASVGQAFDYIANVRNQALPHIRDSLGLELPQFLNVSLRNLFECFLVERISAHFRDARLLADCLKRYSPDAQ